MHITRLRECIDQKVILERRPVPAALPDRNVGIVVFSHENTKDYRGRRDLSFIEPKYQVQPMWVEAAAKKAGGFAVHPENPILFVYTTILDDNLVSYGKEEAGSKVFLGPLSYKRCLEINDHHPLFAQYRQLLQEKGFVLV